MKLAFMGTPDFAVQSLEALINSQDHEVVCVITQPDKPKGRGMHYLDGPVKQKALQYGLPIQQPASLKNNDEFFSYLKKLC